MCYIVVNNYLYIIVIFINFNCGIGFECSVGLNLVNVFYY